MNIILKQLRAETKLTQKETADKLNMSPSTIAMYETGARRPDSETLNRIADFYNVSTDFLLGRSKVRNPYNDIPDEITTIDQAIKFLIDDSSIFGFDGFDVNKLSDDEKIAFANELLEQFKLVSYKYKK